MKKSITLSLLSISIFCFTVFSCKKDETVPEVVKVFALTEKVNGLGYEDLTMIADKWLIGTPPDKSAANDTDGKLSATSLQPNSNVTILAFNFGGKSTRSLTIPSTKPVFVPIIGVTFWYFDNDPCDPDYKPANGQTIEAFLGPDVAAYMKNVKSVTAKLDGVDIVPDVKKYLATSKAYDLSVPADYQDPKCNNVGKKAHALSSSHSLLLTIPKGKHVLQYTGVLTGTPDFETDVTWNLTVE
jgi:hypothetical protein